MSTPRSTWRSKCSATRRSGRCTWARGASSRRTRPELLAGLSIPHGPDTRWRSIEEHSPIEGAVCAARGGVTMVRSFDAIYDGEVLRPVEPLDLEPNRPYRITIEVMSPREPGVLDDLLAFSVDTGIEDLAEQHDHYLYGTPKR